MSNTQEVSKIQCSRKNLPIQSSMFWTNVSSKSFHKNSFSCSGSFTKTQHSLSYLPGRLASCEQKSNMPSERSRVIAQSPDKIGFYNHYPKVKSDAFSGHNIHRGSFQTRQRSCVSNSRENRKITSDYSQSVKGQCVGSELSDSARSDCFSTRVNSERQIVHETDSITSSSKLAPLENEFESRNCLYSKVEIPFYMVVRATKHFAGGRSLIQFTNSVTVTTDASTMGWGDHSENQKAQGTWSPLWKLEHINCLELEAVFRTVKHFLPSLKNKNVLIRSDNTTTVQYINKQGVTRSPKLCQLTWKLWQLAIKNNIVLRSAHIAGSKNVLADSLSRVKVRETEWSLNPKMAHQVFNHLGQPMIDLFASYENKKTQVFCSWVPHPQALALDALSITWENMFAYAFPPTCLIPKVLQHMKQFHCELILIAPHWPRQHWYPQLLELLIACPLKLPAERNLLSQAKGKILHQNPQSLKLTAWLLSTDSSKQREFLKTLENYCLPRGGQVHKKIKSANFDSSVAGVKNRKLIPMLQL